MKMTGLYHVEHRIEVSSIENLANETRAAESNTETNTTTNNTNTTMNTGIMDEPSIRTNFSKISPRQPVVDLVVAILAIPSIVVFALLLETNMTDEWADEPQSRWVVLGLGLGLLFISILVCGYVTHRMGVCLWAGPQDGSDFDSQNNRFNLDANSEHFIDILPPSYDTVMGYDIPPPPYHTIVIIDDEIKIAIPDESATSNYI
jgi:hypothetical protein